MQNFFFCRPNEFDYNFDESAPSPSYTPNLATPGYNPDTPSPHGPFTPQTPGSSFSPYSNLPTPSPTGDS